MSDFDYENMDPGLSYSELLEKYKAKLYHFQFVTKKEMIVRLAMQLEKEGYPKDMISTKLTDDLKGYDITDRYIRDCLGEELKQESKKRIKISEKISASDDKKLIEVSTSGDSISENRNDSSLPPVILPEFDDDDKDLEISRLKEQLGDQIKLNHDLLEGVNKSLDKNKPNKAVTESLEYKAILSQLEIANQRIIELEQIAKKEISETGFQTASNINIKPTTTDSTQTTTSLTEVILDMNLWKLLWKAQPYSMKFMYLKLEGNKIIGVESDSERNSKK